MRVFVSYAREDVTVAEAVVHSIRARGHKVFFDKQDLPPGNTYEDRIEKQIARSDVFVFLISPHSVEPGGFALTELGMAERKWERPAGRVLPVKIADTGFAKIPAYAKAVSILEPRGNIAAETARRVDELRRIPWRQIAASVAAFVTVAAFVGWYVGQDTNPVLETPARDSTPATAFSLPAEISSNAVAVARDGTRDGNGFILLTRNPGTVGRIRPDGHVLSSQQVEGEPTALYVDDDEILVGTRGPDALVRLGADDLAIRSRASIAFPSAIRGSFDDPISSTPVSIARGDGRIWIITRGGASGTGIMHFAPDLADPQVPPYYNETAFDARDMHLSSNGKQVWAARTQTTPASLYRLTSSSITTFGGHDYEIASCASDVLVLETDILVPDCDGKVQRVDANLRITAYVDQLLGYRSGPGTWTEVRLRPSAEGGAAFIVTSMPSLGATGVASSTVSRLMPQRGRKMPLEVSNASILDMALQGDAFMVILENQEGRRETLALKYE